MHLCPATLGPLASDVPHEAKPMLTRRTQSSTADVLHSHMPADEAPPWTHGTFAPALGFRLPHPGCEGDPLPDCFAVPAIHSAGF